MCQACHGSISKTRRRVLTKQDFSPEEERAFQWWLDEYRDALGPIEEDIEGWLNGADADELASLDTIRSELQSRIGGYTSDFETIFREGGNRAAEAGRALAGRRYELDIAFDVIPSNTLDAIDDWVETAAGSTLETITEDATRWLRGAHEEGLSIDEISNVINDELFEGQLEGHVAERAARTGTISTSNAGSESAFRDADSVVATEWLTEIDGREREDHAKANGQVIPVDSTFVVGGVEMDHPGDPAAPIEQIANCRCTHLPRFADSFTDDELEALEAGERLNV